MSRYHGNFSSSVAKVVVESSPERLRNHSRGSCFVIFAMRKQPPHVPSWGECLGVASGSAAGARIHIVKLILLYRLTDKRPVDLATGCQLLQNTHGDGRTVDVEK